jgi:hypothetical protein
MDTADPGINGELKRFGKQIRTGLGDLHVGAVFVDHEPTARERQFETRTTFRRSGLVLE